MEKTVWDNVTAIHYNVEARTATLLTVPKGEIVVEDVRGLESVGNHPQPNCFTDFSAGRRIMISTERRTPWRVEMAYGAYGAKILEFHQQ